MKVYTSLSNLGNEIFKTVGILFLCLIIVFLVLTISLLVTIFQLIRNLYFSLRNESSFLSYLKYMQEFFMCVILGADQFGGCVIYGRRGLDWYVSSIAYYDAVHSKKNIWFMHLINTIFFDKAHCRKSFEDEYKKLKYYPEEDIKDA